MLENHQTHGNVSILQESQVWPDSGSWTQDASRKALTSRLLDPSWMKACQVVPMSTILTLFLKADTEGVPYPRRFGLPWQAAYLSQRAEPRCSDESRHCICA